MTAVEAKSPASAPAGKVWTEEEIINLPDNGYKYEVVDGELSMSPKNNPEHGDICTWVSMKMGIFVAEHRLGRVWDSNTGCWMVNGNLRAPDISFISRARAAKIVNKRTFFVGAPDLIVEVLSYSNTRAEIDDRLKDFFESGTKLAWIIDPEQRIAESCRSATSRKLINVDGYLDAEEVLPGFKLSLAETFRNWD